MLLSRLKSNTLYLLCKRFFPHSDTCLGVALQIHFLRRSGCFRRVLWTLNLLFGKRAIQRFRVGLKRVPLEVPLAVISKLYDRLDTSRDYHNGDYHPLQWRAFAELKVKALHLYEAATSPDAPKTGLQGLDVIPQLATLYAGKMRTAEAAALQSLTATMPARRTPLPIRGHNV